MCANDGFSGPTKMRKAEEAGGGGGMKRHVFHTQAMIDEQAAYGATFRLASTIPAMGAKATAI